MVFLIGCEERREGAVSSGGSAAGNRMASYSDASGSEIVPAVWFVGNAPSRPTARWDVDNKEIVLSITFGADKEGWWVDGIHVYIVDPRDANINMNIHELESNGRDDSVDYDEADDDRIYFETPMKQWYEGDLEINIKDTPDVEQTEIISI
jgi:hypothetical protein